MERPACASGGPRYFFSMWSYEDRAFLRGLYKKFACTKVHFMVQIMTASPGPWNCSHWRMWKNMAREVRSSLKRQVSPKKIEDFFWEVIADGAGHHNVTERLDAMMFGDGASPARKSRALGESTVTEDESTSPEDNQEQVSDDTCEYDVEVADDDRDADFTVSPAKLAHAVSKGVKVSRECAKLHADYEDDLGGYGERIPPRSAQPCARLSHANELPCSVSTEPYVGNDEPMLDDGLPRSDVAVGTVSPASSIQLPEREANRATAHSVDQEVMCKPTCVDVAVQCEIDSIDVAEMMHREHLLRNEVLELRLDLLIKKLGPANT